ncbi:hypothetical protein HC891_14910, partial [Candidatus Gracilibacteria bacterium]|nr:hypothetical protein [Candidatus Gracilibacteria bacterium]
GLGRVVVGTGEGRVIIMPAVRINTPLLAPARGLCSPRRWSTAVQGKGVSSNRGYISVFDLYTHLYFALDEAVPRRISAAVRQRYGEQQEPELTILKGVGPFPVALYRGATTLGDFAVAGAPPEGTAVRAVNPANALLMLRQHQQRIGDDGQVARPLAVMSMVMSR